jgi:hypothetical protein
MNFLRKASVHKRELICRLMAPTAVAGRCGDPNWDDVSEDWPTLADPSPAAKSVRQAQADVVKNTASILSRYELRAFQKSILNQWADGTFQSDLVGIPQPGAQRLR